MPFSLLPGRQLFSVAGEDRIGFLQGLITNDAENLTRNEALYAALLSPQGKFLHDFFLIPDGDRILLDIEATRAEDLIKRFNIYKLRAKVNIAPETSLKVGALWSESNIPAGAIPDPRLKALGYRIYDTQTRMQELSGNYAAGDYEAYRITLGIPDGAKDMQPDKSLLLEYGFEALHGVSFSKGCYVGQEVTARSKFRAQLRKELFQLTADAPLPAPNSSLFQDGREAGILLSAHGTHGLALLRTDVAQADRGIVEIEGVRAEYARPAWNLSSDMT